MATWSAGLKQRQRVQRPLNAVRAAPAIMLPLLSITRASASGSFPHARTRWICCSTPIFKNMEFVPRQATHGAPMLVVDAHLHLHQIDVYLEEWGSGRWRHHFVRRTR